VFDIDESSTWHWVAWGYRFHIFTFFKRFAINLPVIFKNNKYLACFIANKAYYHLNQLSPIECMG